MANRYQSYVLRSGYWNSIAKFFIKSKKSSNCSGSPPRGFFPAMEGRAGNGFSPRAMAYNVDVQLCAVIGLASQIRFVA